MTKNIVILYTPIYYTSPGTWYRVRLIAKSLKLYGFKPIIVTLDLTNDKNNSNDSNILRSLYYRFGDRLLNNKTVYNLLALVQYRYLKPIIRRYKENIRGVILFTDIAVPVSAFLQKILNTKIIASIEDISMQYIHDIKGLNSIRSRRRYSQVSKQIQIEKSFVNQLCESLEKGVDYTITPAKTLSNKIGKECLTNVITVPIGIDKYVNEFSPTSIIEERSRYNYSVLVAGQIFTPIEAYKAATTLLMLHTLRKDMYFYIFAKGRYNYFLRKITDKSYLYYYRNMAKSIRENIRKYMGLVVTARRAYTLTRIYYHTMLMQPIMLYDVHGYVRREAEYLEIALIDVTNCIDYHDLACLEEKLDNMMMNYPELVKNQYQSAQQLLVPHVHRDLLKMLV